MSTIERRGRSDSELVSAARRGDNDAFGELVVRHQDRVFNIALRFIGNAASAEDVAQKVFINAFTRIRDFEEKAQFTTWIYRIAFNEAVSHMRYEGRRRAASIYSEEDGLIAEPASDHDPAAADDADDRRAVLQKALAAIDPDDRKILLLRELEEQSYDQIAEILEVPVGTVRSRLHRAREALRDLLRNRPGTRGRRLRLTPER